MGMFGCSNKIPFEERNNPSIDATLYVKPHTPRRGSEEDLRIPASDIMRTFTGIAQFVSEDLRLNWKPQRWPKPSGHAEGTAAFRGLNATRHSADCAVVVARSAHDVFLQIHALLSTRHRLSHVFVVGLEESDQKLQSSIEQAYNAAPIAAMKDEESDLLIPGFPNEQGPFEYNAPVSQGLISIHVLNQLRKRHEVVRDRLALVCVQKYQNFRRTDIDEDGKTIKSEIFEDWPRIGIEQDDPADKWKPEGWSNDDWEASY